MKIIDSNKLKKYTNFIIGVLISAIVFNLFFLTNNLAPYGVSGLAISLKSFLNINPITFILIANVALIIISYFTLGLEYTKKTILGAILYPIFIKLTAFLPDVIDLSKTNLLAIAIVGGAIAGLGSALIYKEGFGSGGTDVTNQIIHKCFKIPMGTAVAIGEGIVILVGGIAFGLENMTLSLIMLLIMTSVCNRIMIGISQTKTCFIITSKVKEVKEYLIENLKNDITIINKAEGYKKNKQKVLITVVDTKKYIKLKDNVKKIDPTAFISVTDSFEVLNKNKQIKKPL